MLRVYLFEGEVYLFCIERKNDMNDILKEEKIENMIYEVRGKQVMLDSDLARLYGCKNGTKEVNQAVKNNIDKFPVRYSFQLTDEESNNLKSKFLTSSLDNNYGGRRNNPRVFTEQGVYMLATILKGKKATSMTLYIMDAFIVMKKYISNDLFKNNNILINHEARILKLEESLDKLSSKQASIIYDGKIYDAYSILVDILNKAREEIIIIDNYANKELLDILRNINKNIIILSKNLDSILIRKYNNQYDNISFVDNNPFHDRYIILDRKDVYVSGMSLKDIGKKYSYIYKITEELFINELLKRIDGILKVRII